MKSLTQDEMLKKLRVASNNRHNLAMILLGFKHGMRASEVCGLELKDLDLKNDEITIRRLKGSLKTTQPVTDIQAQLLSSEKRVLRAWLEERGNHPSRYVFTTQKSGKMHRSQLHRVFADIAERAGLPKDKRHFHCQSTRSAYRWSKPTSIWLLSNRRWATRVLLRRQFIPCRRTKLLVRL